MVRFWFGLLLTATAVLAIPPVGTAEVATCQGQVATIVGTSGPDLLIGTDGPDVIVGFGGADEIQGEGGNDLICGGAGPDTIYGGLGSDSLFGGAGADHIRADPQVWDSLSGAGDDFVRGGSANDKIWGGDGNDQLAGNNGNDVILGNAGDDTLLGHKKDDLLVGGPGDDSAVGGRGADDCSAESVACDASIPELPDVSVYDDSENVFMEGVITHTEPISSVEFAVKEKSSGLWVQPDGSLSSNRAWFAGTIDHVNPNGTFWSGSIVLPGARYTLAARAFDDDGDRGRLWPYQPFRVPVAEVHVGLPVTDFIYHYEDLIPLPSGTTFGLSPRDSRVDGIPAGGSGDVVRLSGSLLGLIGGVDVSIRNRVTGLWLQEDGSFAAAEALIGARCPNCNDTHDGYWLFDAELPDGEYGLHVFAIDESDNSVIAELDSEWEFVVDASQASTPMVEVDQSPGVSFDATVEFSGSASDDFGVDAVMVSVRDDATGLWLQNLSSPPVWDTYKAAFVADLANRHGMATDWVIEFDLSNGDYKLSVAAFDQVLHRQSIKPWLPFSVDS